MSQSTSVTFEVWKEAFLAVYASNFDKEGIYSFMQDVFEGENSHRNPMKAECKANLDEETHDSYGNEDSILKRVYYFPDWDIYIQFSGTRSSYNGEEWDTMKEVKPTIKTFEVYE